MIVLDKLSAGAVEEILLRAVKRLGVRVLHEGGEVSLEDKDSRHVFNFSFRCLFKALSVADKYLHSQYLMI